jgi:hypothetical protein
MRLLVCGVYGDQLEDSGLARAGNRLVLLGSHDAEALGDAIEAFLCRCPVGPGLGIGADDQELGRVGGQVSK